MGGEEGGGGARARKEWSSHTSSHTPHHTTSHTQGLRTIQQPYEPPSSSPLTDLDTHEALHAFFLRLRTYGSSSKSSTTTTTASKTATAAPPPRTLRDRSNQNVEKEGGEGSNDEKTKKEAAIRAFVDKEGIGRMRRRWYVGRAGGERGGRRRREGRIGGGRMWGICYVGKQERL